MMRRFTLCIYLAVGVISLLTQIAYADVLCVKNSQTAKKNKVNFSGAFKIVTGSECEKGYTALLDTSVFKGEKGDKGDTGTTGAKGDTGATGAAGTTGATGAAGADGSLRIYGDGSDGALNATTDQEFNSVKQYTNITIQAGVTLTVPSGTVIRCSGTFTNNGTVNIPAITTGGFSQNQAYTLNASVGVAQVVASNGASAASGALALGGRLNTAFDSYVAKTILAAPIFAGGGGGFPVVPSGVVDFGQAGYGGGSVNILCKQGITNAGNIYADGKESEDGRGSGGGGGGIIILGAQTIITNQGTIRARGGNGSASGSWYGAGGGGGGGLVHLIAPSINNTGTILVTGGSAGSNSTSPSTNPRSGGGGGGVGSCGSGGDGGDINTSNVAQAADAGGAGCSFITLTDPTSLF